MSDPRPGRPGALIDRQATAAIAMLAAGALLMTIARRPRRHPGSRAR